MPAPPPVPAAQRYPLAIRDFVAYQNQPQDGTKIFIVQNLDGTTTTVDLTLDAAAVTKDLHTEIISLEQILGQKPFMTRWAARSTTSTTARPKAMLTLATASPHRRHRRITTDTSC